ncbi:MAG: hypothetical protein HOF27_00220, partial [Rhodospirillaceae bacterium]|nr:hypothetical protein [Rhodospirillaceae bacterium]
MVIVSRRRAGPGSSSGHGSAIMAPRAHAEGLLRSMHHRWPNSLIFRHPFAAALVVAVLLNTALTNPVQSQSQSGVFVDLSVLNDSGASYGAFGTARSGLIVPPKFAPKSTLHLAPKTKVKLKRPGAGQSMTKKSMPSTPKESVKSAAMK